MSVQVQELIDKIKAEGVQAAEESASEIHTIANKKAEDILQDAHKKAEQIISDAKQETDRFKESANMAVQQSSRDMLLALRQKIEQTLNGIITQDVKDALSSDKLGDIIGSTIKGFLKESGSQGDIKVCLSDADCEKLKKSTLKKLQQQVKQPITFESSADVEKGFTISFDGGKSCFDFTDESLAAFLSSYLNAEVSSLLKEASK